MSKRNTVVQVEVDDEIDLEAALDAYLDDDDARVAKIMGPLEACYVTSARDEKIEAQIKRLIKNSRKPRFPNRPPGPGNRKAGVGLAIIGGSGSGKTEALQVLLSAHPAFPGYGIEGARCLLITVLAPAPCTLGVLGNSILEALGYGTIKPLRENEAWKRVRFHLKPLGIMFLHIDDIHNVLHQANEAEIAKVADTLRNLMISTSWPVQLIISGTDKIVDFTEKDRQLSRRLKFVAFEDIDPKADAEWIKEAVEDFAKAAGLKFVSTPEESLIDRLCRAAAFQMGLIFEILLAAIEISVTAKRKVLKRDDFAAAYADRIVQSEDLNMFLSPVWFDLDPSVILKKAEDEEEPATVHKRKVVRKI
jgi:hypothetical protein